MTVASPETQTPRNDCAVLVLSCDAYADLWAPFFTLLWRHWPDCPYPVYLGTDSLNWSGAGVTTLHDTEAVPNGQRVPWSTLAKRVLSQIKEPYVLLILEDFFLRQSVPTATIEALLEFGRIHRASMVRLIPRPGPTRRIEGQGLVGVSEAGSPYRLCTQAAIWDRKALMTLLMEGESIWEFEHNGNARASLQPDGYFSVRQAVLPYEGLFAHHVVEKGKWLPIEKWIFARQDIGCDFSRRGTLAFKDAFVCQLALVSMTLLRPIPWRLRVPLNEAIKRLARPLLRRQIQRLHGTTRPSERQLEPTGSSLP